MNITYNLKLARRRAGLSQQQAARLFGVKVYKYTRWECPDDSDMPPPMNTWPDELDPEQPYTDAEYCWIKRQQSGLTLKQAAKMSGIPVQQIHAVEKWYIADHLVKFWDDYKATKA